MTCVSSHGWLGSLVVRKKEFRLKGFIFLEEINHSRQKQNYRFYLFDISWYFPAKHVIYILNWRSGHKTGCSTFMTLNKLSCPTPFFSLKKSCSGNVLVMSLRIIRSLGDFCFRYSTYISFIGESFVPSSSCQAKPLNGFGIPRRTSCWKFKNNIWAATWDFQQCGMCEQKRLWQACKVWSSRELKTSKFSFVLRTHENSDVFNTLDEIYLVFTSKKVNILYLFAFYYHCFGKRKHFFTIPTYPMYYMSLYFLDHDIIFYF